MDFEAVLRELTEEFSAKRIRYAAIGGLAVGILGYPRATLDIDLLVHRDDLGTTDQILSRLGYELVHRTKNVSRFIRENPRAATLDFLHAFRSPSLGMLSRAVLKDLPTDMRLPVLQTEDIIGLKVQAMSNDPSRTLKDLSDIEGLIRAVGKGLDWERILDYFEVFGRRDEAEALQRRLG